MPWGILAITLSIGTGFEAERRFGAGASGLARRLLKTLLFCVSPPVAFFDIVHLEIRPTSAAASSSAGPRCCSPGWRRGGAIAYDSFVQAPVLLLAMPSGIDGLTVALIA